MTLAEKRLRAALSHHVVQPSTEVGYVVCFCGCGYIGVCRHCVPTAPPDIPWTLCDVARHLVQSGQASSEEGSVYAISA